MEVLSALPDGAAAGTTQRLECPECGFVAYASSKATAGALVEDDEGRVLLARRAHEPFKGRWDIPGGFLEEGEHPLDGLRRELREETGLEVEPLEFLGVWMDRYGGDSTAEATLNLYWTARVTGGEPRAGGRRRRPALVRAPTSCPRRTSSRSRTCR